MPFEWLPWRRRPSASTRPKSSTTDSASPPPTLQYHAATVLTEARVRATPLEVDWGAQPATSKRYPQVARYPLTEQIGCDLPATLAVVGRLGNGSLAGEVQTAPWNLEAVSRLCYYAYGPTAQQEVPGNTLTLRAAPSAGAQYPTELYLAVRGASGLRNGVYHYAAGEHALEALRDTDGLAALAAAAGDLPAACGADAVVLVSSVWWRSAWRYGDRAYRYCLQDAGHVAGNVALVAMALGYQATIVHHFVDATVAQFLGLDPAVEAVQVLVAVQATMPAPATGAAPSAAPAALRLAISPNQHPADPARIAAIDHAHQATVEQNAAVVTTHRARTLAASADTSRTEPAWLVPLPRVTTDSAPAPSLCQSLLERRSARHFAPVALAQKTFAALLRTLTSAYPTDVPAVSQGTALDVFLIVNDVAGVPPGAYRYLTAEHSLLTIRSGNLREWATHLALDQTFCREAAALAFLVTDLGPLVARCGDRSYRIVHLEAGMQGQATYLAAHALGVVCTGIGAFYDLEVTSFFAAPDQAAVVYVLAMGNPVDY